MSIEPHAQHDLLRRRAVAPPWVMPRPADLWAGLLVASLVLAAGATMVWPEVGETLGPLGMVLGGGVAAWRFASGSRSLTWRERRAWLALAAGSSVASLGVLVVASLTMAGVVVPAFGWHDGFFLAAYAALSLAFLWLAVAENDGPGWPAVILDVIVGAVAFGVIVWLVVGRALVAGFADAPLWEQIVAPLYPVADIAMVLGLMAMTLRRTQFRFDHRLGLLGLGLAFQVLCDLSYLAAGLGSTFLDAAPRYELFLLAFACYLGAALIVGKEPPRHEFPDRPTPLWALVWPYVMAVGLVGAHFVEVQDLHMDADQQLTLVASALVGLLVVVRQVYVIGQHSSRVDAQRRELVASVSHELRTPLTGMLGFLELMEADPDAFEEEERRDLMSTVTDQARHLSSVVGDLIVLARDGGRSFPVKPTTVRLEELGRRAVAMVGAPDVELQVHHDVELHVDVGRMTQALVNLINNARVYGAGRCKVIAGVTGAEAWIEVHDDGPGVPIRDQHAIWNQFERGRFRYDANAPGLGLGLAITRAVAVAHGGAATYRRSEILDGACFVVTVPVRGPL